MRASASLPSSPPAPSPIHREKSVAPTRKTRKGKSKLHKTAGLVAGDSDSSALTQDSGDESVPPTPATGTDGATEYVEEAEHEPDQSPGAYGHHSMVPTLKVFSRTLVSVEAWS